MTSNSLVLRLVRSGAAAAGLTLAGCSVIPAEGPTAPMIEAGRRQSASLPYVVLDVDAKLADRLAQYERDTAPAAAASLPPGQPLGRIGQGDLLRVLLWESNQTGATLIDRAGLDVSSRVEADGSITVPYAGRVAVAGRTPSQAERAIVSLLQRSAASPQASVLVAEDATNSVIVQGDVARPGRHPVTSGSRRLLDVLALAGGPRSPDFLTQVRVARGNASVASPLLKILSDEARNLELAPGDRVLVTVTDRRWYAFGAVSRNGEQPYNTVDMTLAQGLGRISGLQDGRANPEGLFIFRRQPAALTRYLLGSDAPAGKDPTQVVYRVNMRDPGTFFLADSFRIRPQDVVYAANAPLADLAKFAIIISGVSSTAAVPRNFGAY